MLWGFIWICWFFVCCVGCFLWWCLKSWWLVGDSWMCWRNCMVWDLVCCCCCGMKFSWLGVGWWLCLMDCVVGCGFVMVCNSGGLSWLWWMVLWEVNDDGSGWWYVFVGGDEGVCFDVCVSIIWCCFWCSEV